MKAKKTVYALHGAHGTLNRVVYDARELCAYYYGAVTPAIRPRWEHAIVSGSDKRYYEAHTDFYKAGCS